MNDLLPAVFVGAIVLVGFLIAETIRSLISKKGK